MDVHLATIRRGAQVAEVVARVRAETVEFWVGQCLEVVIAHDELLEYLEAPMPQWNYAAFEPIRLHYYPGQLSGISIGSRHHALADLEELKVQLELHRHARRAHDARMGDTNPNGCTLVMEVPMDSASPKSLRATGIPPPSPRSPS